jgi:molybdenum cofactor cytidylyltransferase
MIVGLLLAAGAAGRFGAPKLIQPLRGTPLARWSAAALAAATDALLVVIRPDAAPLREALGGIRARFVVNAEPERGLGRSIACGVRALPADADAVVIALADEPLLETRWIDAVITRYRAATGATIVAPVFRGIRRHPVLFDRGVFAELAALDGDHGARGVVDRDASRVALVEFDEPGTIDVDWPEDLARLEQQPQFTAPSSRLASS